MELARNSSVRMSTVNKVRNILNYSNKGKEVIERTEDLIQEEDVNKMLEVGFKQVRKKNLYSEGFLDSFKSSLYVYKDEFTIGAVNNREEVTLISPQSAKEWKKNGYSAIHLGVIIIGVLSQTRAGLDTKAHLYLYDGRFSNHEQAQLATAEVDLRNKVAVVGCLPWYRYRYKRIL